MIEKKIKIMSLSLFILAIILTLISIAHLIFGEVNKFLYSGMIFLIVICLLLICVNVRRYLIKVKNRYINLKNNIENIVNGNYESQTISDEIDEMNLLLKSVDMLREKIEKDDKYKNDNAAFIRESIANISHDLKTPLSSIRGYAEGLLDGVAGTKEKKDQYAQMIINKVGSISSLLSELGYYSSIDTQGVLDVILPVCVKEYFDDCADEISLDLQMRHINFTYINSVSVDTMFCIDVEKLSKVVRNIIGNSVKFITYDEGAIMLKVEEVDDNILVSIQDNGSGVPSEKLPYIFDRYYKADSARNGGASGSGIGLSIVKKIIEDHGGTVSAESKEGLGTVISFTLRKYEEEA